MTAIRSRQIASYCQVDCHEYSVDGNMNFTESDFVQRAFDSATEDKSGAVMELSRSFHGALVDLTWSYHGAITELYLPLDIISNSLLTAQGMTRT